MKPKRILLFILSIIILLGAAIILWQSRTRVDRVKSRAKEIKEQRKENIPVSQWMPVPIKDYQQQLTTVINAAEKEKSEVESERNKLTGKPDSEVKDKRLLKRYNLLDESIKTLTEAINKEDKQNYIDVNQDNLISYLEFNNKTAIISQAVYNINHLKNLNYDDGIYDHNWKRIEPASLPKPASSQSTNQIQVWVEGGIYDQILPWLTQYKSDVEVCDDYKIDFYICNGCTKEEIRISLLLNSAVGTVFVGDLPFAWFYLYNCWDDGAPETFPIDLYFMDLNGSWTGGDGSGGNPFKYHIEDTSPEIFFGRITSPIGTGQDEINLIKNYFDKNHKYRTGIVSLPHQALVYIDDDWVHFTEDWGNQIGLVYPQRTQVDDPLTTNAADYKERWDDNYEHLFLAAHSDPWEHGFIVNNQWQWVTTHEVRNLKPRFFFYNLYACSNARFSEPNYMAGWYAFQESNYGLVAMGLTKLGGMIGLDKFYTPLSTNNFGTAFKDWFRDYGLEDQCRHYGMTLIGDPTLKTEIACTTPTATPTPFVNITSPTNGLTVAGKVVFNVTTSKDPRIKRVWVKRLGGITIPYGGWVARNNIYTDGSLPPPLDPEGNYVWTTNFGFNDSHPWITENHPDGTYKVKAVALTYDLGTIAESEEITVNLSNHPPTPTPTLTCVPNGGTVSDCSQCCSANCETNPLGPTFCIP